MTVMPQYLLSVWHHDDYGDVDFGSPDMQRIGAKVGALNAEMEMPECSRHRSRRRRHPCVATADHVCTSGEDDSCLDHK